MNSCRCAQCMGTAEPPEEPWCEKCGWSLLFCTCDDKTKFEEEEI